MDARQELIGIFEDMGYPYWMMHQMPNEQKYPPMFFTFLCEDAPYGEYYDNKPCAYIWTFAIGVYGDNPVEVESVTGDLVKRLAASGWIVPDMGEDVQSDEQTHTGRRLTAYKIHYDY